MRGETMSDAVAFSAKNLFLPKNHELHARAHYKKLGRWRKGLTILAAIVGSIVPVFGTYAAFRFCAVKLSKGMGDETVQKTDTVAAKTIAPKPPQPNVGGALSLPSTVVSQQLQHPPALPYQYESRSSSLSEVSDDISINDVLDDMERYESQLNDYKENFCATLGLYDFSDGQVMDGQEVLGDFYDAQFDLPKMDANPPPLRGSRKADLQVLRSIQTRASPVMSTNENVGEAVDNGDCFYDSVAQCLRDQGIDKDATAASVRKCIVDFIETNPKHPEVVRIKGILEKGYDIDGKFGPYTAGVGKTYQQLETEFSQIWEKMGKPAVDRCNKTVDKINALRAQVRDLDKNEDFSKIEDQLMKLLKDFQEQRQAIPSSGIPIWGRMGRDDVFICEAYKAKGISINIETIEVENLAEGESPKTVRTYKEQTGSLLRVVHSPNHFSPVLSKTQ